MPRSSSTSSSSSSSSESEGEKERRLRFASAVVNAPVAPAAIPTPTSKRPALATEDDTPVELTDFQKHIAKKLDRILDNRISFDTIAIDNSTTVISASTTAKTTKNVDEGDTKHKRNGKGKSKSTRDDANETAHGNNDDLPSDKEDVNDGDDKAEASTSTIDNMSGKKVLKFLFGKRNAKELRQQAKMTKVTSSQGNGHPKTTKRRRIKQRRVDRGADDASTSEDEVDHESAKLKKVTAAALGFLSAPDY